MTDPHTDWPEALRAALLATGATTESADRHAARLASDRLAPMPDDSAADVIAEDAAHERNARLDRYRDKNGLA